MQSPSHGLHPPVPRHTPAYVAFLLMETNGSSPRDAPPLALGRLSKQTASIRRRSTRATLGAIDGQMSSGNLAEMNLVEHREKPEATQQPGVRQGCALTPSEALRTVAIGE